jgi:regulator of cell morphogenesis and NO signaling
MLADHDDAGELLAEMRGLFSGYRVPNSACPTYRALYHGLEEFERDLHHHVHMENNILFSTRSPYGTAGLRDRK